jgi:hypothetical protein
MAPFSARKINYRKVLKNKKAPKGAFFTSKLAMYD